MDLMVPPATVSPAAGPAVPAQGPRRRPIWLVALAIILPFGPIFLIDLAQEPISRFVKSLPSNRDVVEPLKEYGSFLPPTLMLIFLYILDPRRLRRALFGGASLLLAGLGVQAMKMLVSRARPEVGHGAWDFQFPGGIFNDGYGSFPSGHAATAFALSTVLSATFPRGRWGFFILALGTCLARVVDGRHFPTDVYAGAILGIVSARLLLHLEARWAPPPATGS